MAPKGCHKAFTAGNVAWDLFPAVLALFSGWQKSSGTAFHGSGPAMHASRMASTFAGAAFQGMVAAEEVGNLLFETFVAFLKAVDATPDVYE